MDEILRRLERIERVLAEYILQDAKSIRWRPMLWALRYWRRRALRKGDRGC
jgi:hypothetical protein